MFGLTKSDIALIVGVLQCYPEIEEAIIFGSRAMGNYKPGSDIDIALKGHLSYTLLGDVFAALNERLPLPYQFDIVAYSSLPYGPLIEHIDRYGKVLYKPL